MYEQVDDSSATRADSVVENHSLPGVIADLGELPVGAIITEEGAARLFNRHVVSVKRAVERGELPQPCRLFGVRVWTAGVLISHIEHRLTLAAKDAEKTAKRLAKVSSGFIDT